MDLFRKKSVDQLVAESTPLKRTMRTFDLTMLGIGAIIGTGIFVLTGKGALTAGPALSVSFLLAAVCCGFAGLCYAEFAAMAPMSGSAYSYAYLAFGELIAFVIGWDLILEYALQAADIFIVLQLPSVKRVFFPFQLRDLIVDLLHLLPPVIRRIPHIGAGNGGR